MLLKNIKVANVTIKVIYRPLIFPPMINNFPEFDFTLFSRNLATMQISCLTDIKLIITDIIGYINIESLMTYVFIIFYFLLFDNTYDF